MDDDIAYEVLYGLSENEKIDCAAHKIECNKLVRRFRKDTDERLKGRRCYVCGKDCSSFCKSHSVPRFCLKRISLDGKVYSIVRDFPILENGLGVGDAGTFQIICRNCDSRVFQDYENPDAYNTQPSGKVLAQIALKNYLHMISKRKREIIQYSLLDNAFGTPAFSRYFAKCIEFAESDLAGYNSDFERAKRASSGKHDSWYHLYYYKKLNYVVPLAAQAAISMTTDFEGNIINNKYNESPDYSPNDIQVAVFPLNNSSIILMFVDSRIKSYSRFKKQFMKCNEEDQLAAINYILHKYSENVFLSKSIPHNILNDPNYKTICRSSEMILSSTASNSLSFAIKITDLSDRASIPNLLSRKYALS